MQDAPFRESAPLLPRNLTIVLAVVLVATLAFMVFSQYVLDTEMASWVVPVSAVVFAAAIVFAFAARMDVEISDDGVRITHLFRTREFARDEIIDKRTGELEQIRNFSNWNLKGVSHRSYTRVGDEGGVALKLKGKRVVVFSAASPEEAFARVPTEVIEDA